MSYLKTPAAVKNTKQSKKLQVHERIRAEHCSITLIREKKTLSSATSSTTNPTLIDLGLKPILHSQCPVVNALRHGTQTRLISTQNFLIE
jgi:hypothetical protein